MGGLRAVRHYQGCWENRSTIDTLCRPRRSTRTTGASLLGRPVGGSLRPCLAVTPSAWPTAAGQWHGSMRGGWIKEEGDPMAEVLTGKNPRRRVVVERRRDPGGDWHEAFYRETWQGGRFHREEEGGPRDRQEAQAWADDPGADEGR
jgi:hypothetical protein